MDRRDGWEAGPPCAARASPRRPRRVRSPRCCSAAWRRWPRPRAPSPPRPSRRGRPGSSVASPMATPCTWTSRPPPTPGSSPSVRPGRCAATATTSTAPTPRGNCPPMAPSTDAESVSAGSRPRRRPERPGARCWSSAGPAPPPPHSRRSCPRGPRCSCARSTSARSRTTTPEGRLARSVYYQDATGTWVDAGRAVLAGGHAMWFPHSVGDLEKPEYAHNLEYRRLVDDAAARGVGLWSAGYCGTSAPASVRTWVVSDPIGDDANNEYVVVLNDSDAAAGRQRLDGARLVADHAHPAGRDRDRPPRPHPHPHRLRCRSATPTPRDFHFGGPSPDVRQLGPGGGLLLRRRRLRLRRPTRVTPTATCAPGSTTRATRPRAATRWSAGW